MQLLQWRNALCHVQMLSADVHTYMSSYYIIMVGAILNDCYLCQKKDCMRTT